MSDTPQTDPPPAAPDALPPAEVRIGPVAVPWAVIGIATVVVAGISLVGGLGLMGAMLNEEPGKTDCALDAAPLGWVELDVGRMGNVGRTHTLAKAATVHATRPRSDLERKNPLCTLPRGTVLSLSHRPERGRAGVWVQVDGADVALPE